MANQIVEKEVPVKTKVVAGHIYKCFVSKLNGDSEVAYFMAIKNNRFSSWNLADLINGTLLFEKDVKSISHIEETLVEYKAIRVYSLTLSSDIE